MRYVGSLIDLDLHLQVNDGYSSFETELRIGVMRSVRIRSFANNAATMSSRLESCDKINALWYSEKGVYFRCAACRHRSSSDVFINENENIR